MSLNYDFYVFWSILLIKKPPYIGGLLQSVSKKILVFVTARLGTSRGNLLALIPSLRALVQAVAISSLSFRHCESR